MPYRDVYDLDNDFEEIVQNSEEYSEIFNSSSVYDTVAVEKCVKGFMKEYQYRK